MKTLQPLGLLLLLCATLSRTHAVTPANQPSSITNHSFTPFHYRIRAIDTQGQPVSGALFELYRGPESPTSDDWNPRLLERRTADADGIAAFTITNQAVLLLVVSKPGLSFGWTTCYPGFPGLSPEDGTTDLTLTAPNAVSGIVQDAAGKPLPDAQVWVSYAFRAGKRDGSSQSWQLLTSQQGKHYLAARTKVDGKFHIDGLPADATLNLSVVKPGLALDQAPQPYLDPDNLSFHAGQSNIVLTLKPGATIEGRVVREDNGAPLAGARVSSLEASFGGNAQPSALTGPDGLFRLSDLGPGEYSLRAIIGTNRFPDWVCDTVTVSVEAGATNRDVKISAGEGGVLEVTVTDQAADQPVERASIIVSRDMAGESATTAANGGALLRLPPGDGYIVVSKRGLRSYQSKVSIERGQTNHIAVALQAAPTISGTVVDPDGKLAPKATVILVPFYQGEKQTDAEGRFALTPNEMGEVPGQFQRAVIARDPVRNLAVALDIDEQATNTSLRLEPGVSLAGRVVDPKGKPIAGAEAQVMLQSDRYSSSLGSPTRVDAEGRFEVKGLPRGHRYGVNVSAKGFGTVSRNITAEDAAASRVELDPFELPLADQRVAGVVLDADDKPVASAWVNAYGDRQPQRNTRTDAKGRFALEQVCAGVINLSANTPRGNGFGNATAEAGDTNITIHLGVTQNFASSGPAKLSGTVTGPDGKPVSKVVVTLFPFQGSDRPTDAEGRFKLSFNPNEWGGMQQYQRVLIARDPARNLAVALDVEPDATNAALKLEPGLVITGRVADLSGKAIPNAEAQVMFHTDRMSSSLGAAARADAGGRFEIKALPRGRHYTVNASAKGFGQDNRDVEAPEGETRLELEPLQLLPADQRIAGIVLDADDKPVAGASVNTYGDKQPNLNGQTDAKGRFALDKVCAGQIHLYANSQGASYRYGNATAEGGDTNIIIHVSSSPGARPEAPRPVSLKGKPLPDLAPLGFAPADCPPGQPVLAVLIDAEQRPSRRALRLLGDQAAALKLKGISVVVLQSGTMAEDAFAAWKQEAGLPFPIRGLKDNPDKARLAWGAAALPWLILTDKSRQVIAEGFAPDELDAKLSSLAN